MGNTTAATSHKPRPESQHWFTVKQGGRWHDKCVGCDRDVVWTAEGWRHAPPRKYAR